MSPGVAEFKLVTGRIRRRHRRLRPGRHAVTTGITEDLWSVVHFQGAVYVASLTGLYRLEQTGLVRVAFDGDTVPHSFYALDTFEDAHLLSVGDKDAVMSDGRRWSRVL